MGVYGKGEDCKFFVSDEILNTTTAVVSHPLNAMQDYDVNGLQLVVDPKLDGFDVTNTDHVVSSTKTFTFANGGFTAAMIGGILTIEGSVADDGDYTIVSRTNATTIVVSEAVPGDETFDDTVTAFVTFPLLEGAWMVEVSNDTTPAGMAGSYDQDSDVEGHWTDITSYYANPSIATVDSGAPATYSQYAQATICVRSMRFTFTPTTGYGTPMVLGQARSYQ